MKRAQVVERYAVENSRIVRELSRGSRGWRSSIENRADSGVEGHAAWWQSFLRGGAISIEQEVHAAAPIRSVDAFCGCGGLTLGGGQAALAVGHRLESLAAIDVDEAGLEVHRANFGTRRVLCASVSSLVDFHVNGAGALSQFAYPPEIVSPVLAEEAGNVDLFLAGPPCQGHSNLNNRTRREDPRNLLYLTAVAMAVGLGARMVLIENVPDVVNDRSDVVTAAKALFRASGYRFVDSGVLAAHELGWAQARKRFFLLAARENARERPGLRAIAEGLRRAPQSVGWAIGDLVERPGDETRAGVMETVPNLSDENKARIGWLFENDEYELPNEERPDCHKDGHSYPSVYGRMYWDRPAQTITTGFLTPGRGRYIHSSRRRVITPHEAARIQGFPDTFRFVVNGDEPARLSVTKWIGDAVPPVLGYAAALPLFMAEL
jgi:DNA (cytosine-5)-methyltransferase 1